MSILALDLGTHCGHALAHPTGVTVSGTWDLSTKRHEDAAFRFIRFREHLSITHRSVPLTVVYFEEVRRHAGTTAAHIYGGLMAMLKSWCVDNGVSYCSVPVGEIKKRWTGKGNASKDEMIAEAKRRGYDPLTDDEADALAILVLKTEGNGT